MKIQPNFWLEKHSNKRYVSYEPRNSKNGQEYYFKNKFCPHRQFYKILEVIDKTFNKSKVMIKIKRIKYKKLELWEAIE